MNNLTHSIKIFYLITFLLIYFYIINLSIHFYTIPSLLHNNIYTQIMNLGLAF